MKKKSQKIMPPNKQNENNFMNNNFFVRSIDVCMVRAYESIE